MEVALNKLIVGVREQTKLTANELVLRPTFTEEFENLRDNMQERVYPGNVVYYEGDDEVSNKSSRSLGR